MICGASPPHISHSKVKDIMAVRMTNIQTPGTHLEELQGLFKLLSEKDVEGKSGFSLDKDAILKVFRKTEEETYMDILARLTLIDSMYSTQMNRRYYALDELASALVTLSNGKRGKLKQLFIDFAKDPEANLSRFDYDVDKEHKSNLFSECYGIGKDGKPKGVAISLISKYAYFETDFQFPIYDSIACEMYPLVWKYCGFENESIPKLMYQKGNGRVIGDKTIVEYIKAINLLIEKLDCSELNYDLLDRFLWYVGKIRRGNLSLVLSCEHYKMTMLDKNGIFNIEGVDLNKLDYLKDDPLLFEFFRLAKKIKQ